jgi:hypothetical protein
MTMLSDTPPEHEALYDALRRAAALRDTFQPMQLLQDAQRMAGDGAVSDDPVIMAEALSALQADCVVDRGTAGPIWSLRPAVRRKVLGQGEDPAFDRAMAQGEGPVVEALRGTGAFSSDALQAALAPQVPSQTLTHLVGTLDRAGPRAPGYQALIALRSAMNTAEQRDRAEAILSLGFFGRQEERAQLASWIATPQTSTPLRTLHISGLPGIGKSFLLEKIIQEAVGRDDPILIRLDFDRSGLMVEDTHAFFEEISRQLGDAVPRWAGDLRDRRLQSARERSSLSGREARFILPRDLLSHMGQIAREDGRVVLVVLDTLEVLRARGETAVMTLFDHLDRLVEFGLERVSVISAGRGDALDPVPKRLGGRLHLQGLESDAEDALLDMRGVPTEHWEAIKRLARGNPLLLTLAARALAQGQGPTVTEAESQDPEVVGGYLYRAILSRLPQPLNDLAHAGLELQRLNAAVLAEVLAPALSLTLDPAGAVALFDDLSTQHWLMAADDLAGWLRHRSEMRAAFFPLMVHDRPDLVRRISQRAVDFADMPEADRLYHRLQLTRWGEAMPPVPAEIAAQFTPIMLDELPEVARDAVLQAQGLRSGYGRTGTEPEATPAPKGTTPRRDRNPRSGNTGITAKRKAVLDKSFGAPRVTRPSTRFVYNAQRGRLERPRQFPPGQIDDRAIRDLQLMLANGDQREAGFILANSFNAGFEAKSPAGQAVMCYLWLSGQWAGAVRLWKAMGKPNGADSSDPVLARIYDEIFAEQRFGSAVKNLSGRPMPPEPGRVALIGGALDVAGIMAHGRPNFGAKVAPAQGAEYAAALLAPWLSDGDSSALSRLRAEADKRRERFGLSGQGIDLPGWQVAPLTPHIAPLAALCGEPKEGPRARWLAALRPHLPQILALQTPWLGEASSVLSPVGDGATDMIDVMAVLGLTADWVGAMSLTLRDGDLRILAASTEQWRRLSHGQWPFARPTPKGWTRGAEADQATQMLMQNLLDQQDNGQTATQLLRLWSAPGGVALKKAIGTRLDALQRANLTAEGALAKLARQMLPPGIAAPLAVLASLPKDFSPDPASFLTEEI